MEGARLEVALEPHPDGFGPAGAETVELLVATNPGMPVSPLKEAASGGEISRIMLALTGLAGEARGTIVFDEIDAGIGGATARAVGERLRRLGEARQVLCITHLPQVASLADTHFTIEKRAEGGTTVAEVARVADDDLVAEIVRMLGAEDGDDAAAEHARGTAESRLTACPGTVQAWPCGAAPAPTSAVPRSAPTPPGPPIVGAVRVDKKTKDLVKRLRPGEIAVIDHADLDRIAAEDLVAAGAGAVVNVAESSTGRYPNPGPLILASAGVRLIDAPAAPLFEQLKDGRRGERSSAARSAARTACSRAGG